MTVRSPGRFELWRLWLAGNGAWLGLVLGIAIMAALFVLVLALVQPLGPTQPVQGTVNSLSVIASRIRGPSHWARIDVDGKLISLRMTDGDRCIPGQPVKLLKRQTKFGYRYAFTLKGCSL